MTRAGYEFDYIYMYSIYQFKSWFTLQTSDYDVVIDFRVDDVIQNEQRHDDLIKALAVYQVSVQQCS